MFILLFKNQKISGFKGIKMKWAKDAIPITSWSWVKTYCGSRRVWEWFDIFNFSSIYFFKPIHKSLEIPLNPFLKKIGYTSYKYKWLFIIRFYLNLQSYFGEGEKGIALGFTIIFL